MKVAKGSLRVIVTIAVDGAPGSYDKLDKNDQSAPLAFEVDRVARTLD